MEPQSAWLTESASLVDMWLMGSPQDSIHGKVPADEAAGLKLLELDTLRTTQHFWTVCSLWISRHNFPNQINFISC